jgi:hypothetical protein
MLKAQTADTSEVMQSKTWNIAVIQWLNSQTLTADRKTGDLSQFMKDVRMESTRMGKEVDVLPTCVTDQRASTDYSKQ